MKLFVLATCRREDLFPYTRLVFKTIRVGFPTAELIVQCNGLNGAGTWGQTLKDDVDAAGGTLVIDDEVTHHEWIRMLLSKEDQPFWISDTDIIYFRKVEHWVFDAPMAGYRVPEFFDEFTQATTRARLHTSLLYLDPVRVRTAAQNYLKRHPSTQFNPPVDLVNPLYLPLNGQTYFYDTCSLLFHAIGGKAFTDTQKDAYFHFHFGSFSDLVLPAITGGELMGAMREAILAEPSLGMGMWRAQEEYYAARQVRNDGVNVIAPISQKDAEEGAKWNVELCCGNQNAMRFCDHWYHYCHGIDDLIDTIRDGRPRMSKDQIISLFFRAALLYNCDFYVNNRDVLAPIVLLITNTYRDSVAWEQSPRSDLRKMGDVFRTCGNEMLIMVALICGGEAHMRKMSLAIKERDFVLQHDSLGNPL